MQIKHYLLAKKSVVVGCFFLLHHIVSDCQQRGLVVKAPCLRSTWSRSKLICAILLCPWERQYPLLVGFGKEF